jgi:hypothetical protein
VFDDVEAVDGCGSVEITYSDAFGQGTCSNTQTRTWTATDECGNASLIAQKITIVDTEAPLIGPMPDELFMTQSEYDLWEMPSFLVTDCGNYQVEMQETVEATCETVQHYYTHVATDVCGNSSSHTLMVQVLDAAFGADLATPGTVGCGEQFDMSVQTFNGTSPYSFSWQIVSGSAWAIVGNEADATATIQAGDGPGLVKVQVVDANGCAVTRQLTVECEGAATGVAEQWATSLELFPNPVGDQLSLRFGTPTTADGALRILNMLGEAILMESIAPKAGSNEYRLDVSQLPAGTYLLQLHLGESTTVKKFVKIW